MHAGAMLVVAVTGLAACRDSPSERPAPPSAPPVVAVDAAAEPPANLDRPVRRTLATGALHRYRLTLEPGASCDVVVTQDGVDVVVEAFGPDHARIARVDSTHGRHGH